MNNNIFPCLWFDNNATEAAVFYTAAFGATIQTQSQVVTNLDILGQRLMLLNGGPVFTKNASISLMLICNSADELQQYWDALAEEGIVLMPLDAYPFADKYGWIRDKFGMTWQLYFKDGYTAEQRMVPTLMFVNANNGNARAAIELYTGIFPNSKTEGILSYQDGGEGDVPENVQHAEFIIDGYKLACMDSSMEHQFNFSEGISMVVMTDNQEETDKYWDALLANGGSENQCGWLRDQFGLSWQIVPKRLAELIGDAQNVDKAQKAMNAVLKMKRIDIAALEAAYHA